MEIIITESLVYGHIRINVGGVYASHSLVGAYGCRYPY